MTAEHCACLCTGHASCLNAHRLLDRSESSLCSRRLSERLAYLVSLLPRLCKQKAWCEMISEWEKLEALSKDELIIELMKERTAHRELNRALRSLIELDYPSDKVLPIYSDDDDPDYGYASKDWLSKIATYAYHNSTDRDSFSFSDLRSYGLSDDMADAAYLLLRQKGVIDDNSRDLNEWF